METQILEMLVTVGVPSFITLFLFYLKEALDMRRLQSQSKIDKARAFALVENDMKDTKEALLEIKCTLNKVQSELVEMRERIARLEK